MRPIVTDRVACSVCHSREPRKKWLNRSRCRLDCELECAKEPCISWGVQITPCERAIIVGKYVPADLSPLAATNVLVQCQRCSCGGVARGARVHSSLQGMTRAGEYDSTICVQRWCGLLSNYFDHLLLHYVRLMAFFQDNLGKLAPES